MSRAARPTRRAVLAAGPAALLAAACTGDAPAPVEPVAVDPDDALRASAAERERALLREYDTVLHALPELSQRLRSLRADHAEHLEALLGPAPPASPSSPASPQPSGTAAVPAVPPPSDAPAALARLAAAEQTTGELHAADCLAASRSLAPVLASLSASELSHPVALA